MGYHKFEKGFSERGAFMGRANDGYGTQPTKLRLFRVQLDNGGYDNSGAYWGHGEPLYCALSADHNSETGTGYRRFVRAYTRSKAAELLGLTSSQLAQKL